MKKIESYTPVNIAERLKLFDELQNSIRTLLSIPTQNISLWVTVSKEHLTLFTDNPHLATQIQYQQKNIRDYVNNVHKLNLNGVNLRLIPAKIASPIPKLPTKSLSNATVKEIFKHADSVQDSELSALIRTFAQSKVKQNQD